MEHKRKTCGRDKIQDKKKSRGGLVEVKKRRNITRTRQEEDKIKEKMEDKKEDKNEEKSETRGKKRDKRQDK